MVTATHSAESVVPKATVATARGATMQTTIRGLFRTIYKERTEGAQKKKRDIRFYAEINMHFIFRLRGSDGEKLDSNIRKIMVYCLTFATSRKPGFYVYSTNTT